MSFKWLAWKNYKKKIIKIVNRFKKISKIFQQNQPLYMQRLCINSEVSRSMKKAIWILVLGLLLSGNAYAYDSTKYYKCYGEMTTAHKARGLHKSNRPLSIKIKETVCKAYANGEIDSYEGKE